MKPRMLLWLYPPAWRARYGAEFVEILSGQRLGPAAIIDIVGGAIDAWLQPQSIVTSAHSKGDPMTSNLLKRCAAGGAQVSPRDQKVGAAVMVGGSLILAAVYIYLAARYRGNQLVDAFGIMAFPLAMTLSLPFGYLKHHTWTTKALIMIVVVGILGLASFLASLI